MRTPNQRDPVVLAAIVLLVMLGILLVAKVIIPVYGPMHSLPLELVLLASFVVINQSITYMHEFGWLEFDRIIIRILSVFEIIVAISSFCMALLSCHLHFHPGCPLIHFIPFLSYTFLAVCIPGLYVQFHGLMRAIIKKLRT